MAVVGESLPDLHIELDVERSRGPVVLGCLRLPAQPADVGRARQFARMVLELSEAEPEPIADAELITSELITNVVVHDDWDVEPFALVALAREGATLRLEVHDSYAYMGELKTPDETSEDGRGLGIVAELAERWGMDETPDGKCVWAELAAWPLLQHRRES